MRTSIALRTSSAVLGFLCVSTAVFSGVAQGQASGKSASSSGSASGFSIETEMLTYRALESDSQAIACDVTAYLSGTKADFNHSTGGSICNVAAGGTQAMVVLLPFDKTELADFALWRADMASIAALERKAAAIGCPKTVSRAGTATTTAPTTALNAFLAMSPAGPSIAAAQGIFGLLASEESTEAVGGNIQDLAFMNSVARQLRVLRVPVVAPASYAPASLDLLDEATSPFLGSKQRLLLTSGCLSDLAAKNDANAASAKETVAEIDAYIRTLTETLPVQQRTKPTTSTTPAAGSATTAAPAPVAAPATSTVTPTTTTAANPTTPTHLSAVLRADGFAQKLGYTFDPATGELSNDGPARHVLLVKALESGGSVNGRTNLLGSKIRYGGGAVGTYALFTSGGDLECSGNVYDYVGSINSKTFAQELRKFQADPGQQVIFHDGNCVASPSSPTTAAPKNNPIH